MSATTAVSSRAPSGLVAGRLRATARRRPALSVAAVVLAVALTGLLVSHRPTRLAVAPAKAIAAFRADPGSSRALARARITRIQALPLDSHLDQLIVYDGPRMIYQADVDARGIVVGATDLRGGKPAFGSGIANDVRVLALLSVVFVLVTAVWPLWRLRNLDVLVAVSLVSSVVLVNDMLPVALVAAVYPALLYLAARCTWLALGPARPPRPSVALFDRLTAGWTVVQRRRLLRLIAGASGLIVAMVGLSSLHVVDVGYAVMEGATLLVHGTLPYGHIPDILHGDTYPLLSYLAYVPFAWLTPVRNVWGDADLTLAVAVGAALLSAGLLVRAGRTAPRAQAADAGELAGLRAAIAWLTFPTALLAISTGTTDLALSALLLGAVLAWRRPLVATAILTVGGWFKLVPLALLPLALAPLRARSLARAAALVAAISAPMVGLLVLLGGAHGLAGMLSAISFQQTRVSARDLWPLIGSVPLQQLAQALTLALIAGAAVRLRADRGLARDRMRVAAVCAAVLLGIQISANYWTSFYLSWLVPLLAFSLLTNDARQPIA